MVSLGLYRKPLAGWRAAVIRCRLAKRDHEVVLYGIIRFRSDFGK